MIVIFHVEEEFSHQHQPTPFVEFFVRSALYNIYMATGPIPPGATAKNSFLAKKIPKPQLIWTKFGPHVEDLRRIDTEIFVSGKFP